MSGEQCGGIHLLFKGRYDYFTRPIPVSFGLGISSERSALRNQLEKALLEIRSTIVEMFNQWHQSFKQRSAPIQLRFLLAAAVEVRRDYVLTAIEFGVRNDVLPVAVFSSPHFSDEAFTARLLNCLVDTIKITGGEVKTRAMLCFCVLCAIDSESIITVPEARNDGFPRS